VKNYPPSDDFIKTRIQRYCAYQERCSRDVEAKLNEWKVPTGKINKIIKELKEADFLDDNRFARIFVHGKFSINQWGRKKIIYELKNKGIPGKIIVIAVEEIDETRYMEVLKTLIKKKIKEIKAGKNLTIREKLINFVLAKGYEFDLILQTLNYLKI